MKLFSKVGSILVAIFYLNKVVYGCMEGDLRLIGERDNFSGQVEFCQGGIWGAVCDEFWDEDDARVVCRQLGLPTEVVRAMEGFGNEMRNSNILIGDIECIGTENRLENCPVSIINGSTCAPFYQNGVACYPDDRCTSEHSVIDDLAECDEELKPSPACVHNYGMCVPFYSPGPTICDKYYTPGIDYVFVPTSRRDGKFYKLIKDVIDYGETILRYFEVCQKEARTILCYHYLPPCGNSTHFQPPSAVCSKYCKQFTEQCDEEWTDIIASIGPLNIVLASEGLEIFNCDSPGDHLDTMPYCCTDAGLNFTQPSHADNSNSKGTAAVAAVAVLVIPLIIIPVIIILLYYLKFRHRKEHDTKDVITAPIAYTGSSSVTPKKPDIVVTEEDPSLSNLYSQAEVVEESGPQRPRVLSGFIRKMSEDKLLVPERCITLSATVGQGEFGIVYRGLLSNWKNYVRDLVAIKTLKGSFNSSDLKKLAEESQIMSKFDHPHVMKLLGVAINRAQQTLYVIMPFMKHGSLLSYLRRFRADLTVENEEMTELIKVTSSKLLSVCLQVAKGMNYLASEKFIHRDLAARNCMIDSNNVIKVADFGLSEDIYSRNYFRQGTDSEDGESSVKLPVRWMALESLNDGIFSEKTDVWSFGVTCWEVFSLGKNPYPGVDPFSLIRYLERGERLDKPFNVACSQEIYEMMKQCWDKEPENRLNFSELVSVISTILEGMSGYLDLTTPSFSDVSEDC